MSKNNAVAIETMQFEDYIFFVLSDEDCEFAEYIRKFETDWAHTRYNLYLANRKEKVMTFSEYVLYLGGDSAEEAGRLWWEESSYCQKRYDAYLTSFFEAE